MQVKTVGLLIVPSLVIASLACAQGEKQGQGQEEDDGAMLAQEEQHDEGGKPHEAAKGHSHDSAELHGGAVIMTPEHHFEVVFAAAEIRVYAYDGKQNPINEMKDAKVALALQAKDGDPEDLALEYLGPDEEMGRSQGYFAAPYELGEVEEGQMKAVFTVSGMGKEPIKFKTAVSVSELVTYACPMHADITGEDPIACSKCGMALTKQMGEETDHEEKEDGHEGHNH